MYAKMGCPLTSTIRLSVDFPGGRKRANGHVAIGGTASDYSRHLGRNHFSAPPISRLRVASRWPSRCITVFTSL